MAAPKYLDERGKIIAPTVDRPSDLYPVTVRLPSIADLSSLSDAELYGVAQRFGIFAPWRERFQHNTKYIEQIGKIPENSVDFWNRIRDITGGMGSQTTALGIARGAVRSYNQLIATDGREDQVLVRVGEGDENMCEGCMAIEGAEGTYGEHDAIGLPGSQDCGQNCRCMLIPVETPDMGPRGENLLTGLDDMSLAELLSWETVEE